MKGERRKQSRQRKGRESNPRSEGEEKERERKQMTAIKRGADLAGHQGPGRPAGTAELNSGSWWFVYIVGARREELSVGCIEQVGMRGTWGAGGGGGGGSDTCTRTSTCLF